MQAVLIRTLFAGILLLLLHAQAFSHGGGLDASGCHTNRKTGEYHCHRGSAPASPRASGGNFSRAPAGSDRSSKRSVPPVILDEVGRCHDALSPGYGFATGRELASMEECTKAGGKNWRDARYQPKSLRSGSDVQESNGVVLRTSDGRCEPGSAHLNETLSNVTVFPTMEMCLAAPKSPSAKNQAAQSGIDSPVTKKSSSGVCLEPSDAQYEKTREFDAFGSVEECLASGGRLAGQ